MRSLRSSYIFVFLSFLTVIKCPIVLNASTMELGESSVSTLDHTIQKAYRTPLQEEAVHFFTLWTQYNKAEKKTYIKTQA